MAGTDVVGMDHSEGQGLNSVKGGNFGSGTVLNEQGGPETMYKVPCSTNRYRAWPATNRGGQPSVSLWPDRRQHADLVLAGERRLGWR